MKHQYAGLLLLLLLLICPLLCRADATFEGLSFSEEADYIDLGDVVVTDFEAFASFLERFPNLTQVDMWKNHMKAEQCEYLASRFPQIRWGWTMVIRNRDHEHLVRTDYTSWSTLHSNKSAKHNSEDFSVLKYCWDLKALDIGHNNVTSLDFLYDLPNLRVLILACNAIEDITPVASLKKLEYVELFKNRIKDISPLEDLPHLMDLNLCFNYIKDLSPLLKLTTLKRLWLFSCEIPNKAPAGEQIEAIKAAFPNTTIDTTHYSTLGGWRKNGEEPDPHYAVILQLFGSDHLHPRTNYVPFGDSWTEDGESEDKTPLELMTPQDFSDKGYLLPVDFSVGARPKSGGYTDDHTYSDSTISVSVGSGVSGTCDYWYADIILSDASQLRTLSAGMDGSFESSGEMDMFRLAQRSNGVLVLNGDYWNSTEKYGLGYIIRQGILYQNSLEPLTKWNPQLLDVLLIDENGDFIGLHLPSKDSIPGRVNGKRILNAFSFGPILVENGHAVEDFCGADRWFNMAFQKPRQRMCICQVDHLHYKVVCCAGPFQKNGGMTIREFADLVATLNVRIAYNLDGGDSSFLYFNGKKVNEFGYQTERRLTDIIYFASAE